MCIVLQNFAFIVILIKASQCNVLLRNKEKNVIISLPTVQKYEQHNVANIWQNQPNVHENLEKEKKKNYGKQACCAGFRRIPFVMQLHE